MTQLKSENTDQAVIGVTNGTLLIFPAWLHDAVNGNTSTERRPRSP